MSSRSPPPPTVTIYRPLLVCCCRQVRLYAAGIMDVVDDIFNALDWDQPCLSSQEHFARTHGPGCECNVDSNLKIQFLRMLQSLGKFSVSSPMLKEIDAVQGELLKRQPPSLPSTGAA